MTLFSLLFSFFRKQVTKYFPELHSYFRLYQLASPNLQKIFFIFSRVSPGTLRTISSVFRHFNSKYFFAWKLLVCLEQIGPACSSSSILEWLAFQYIWT